MTADTSAPASHAHDDGLPVPQRYRAIAAVIIAIILVVLDGAIANVALPTLATSLKVDASVSVWVVTAYQVALVLGLLPCAALGESYGYRRVFVIGVAIFTLASALCAMSPSLPFLVAARFLQGLGGTASMSLSVALLRFSVPHHQLGPILGWNAMAIALSAAAGPTIGAAILSISSWPWLFAVNLPIGALVLFASRYLPDHVGTGRPLDLISVGLNALIFAPLVIAVEFILTQPWIAAGLFVLACVSLVALLSREMPQKAPLIPIDLLRERSFRISAIASVFCFTGQMAGLVSLPFYLQHGLGLDAFWTGLYMTPWPLTVAISGPVSGRLSNRISTGWLCAAGCTCLALGLLLASLWPLHGSANMLIPFTIISGLGFGFFQVPNNRNMLLSAPKERSGAAGGLQGTARLTGQTMGAVMMTLLFALLGDTAPRIGLGIAAAFALIGGLVSVMRAGSIVSVKPK